MLSRYEYYSKFKWALNPFTLTILPELMVGYSEQTNSILSHIYNLHKFALIAGPTGSGKTTLLLWLRAQLMAYKKFLPFYIPKPPKSAKNLVFLFKSIVGFNFLDTIRSRNLSVYNLSRFVHRKLRNKHLVLLLDEAHESSLGTLEWVRTITDSVPNMTLFLAGLPVFETNLSTTLPTLSMRITTKVYLNNLSRSETGSLILKRIENIGGGGSQPFTTDATDKIFEVTGGFPREIIKVCDNLVKAAADKNVSNINRTFVEQFFKTPEAPEIMSFKIPLSDKQQKILEILDKFPNSTPTEIVERLDITEYKNRDNAVRSINNILKRLLKDDLIQRKKLRNSYVYFLSGKAKTIFTEA